MTVKTLLERKFRSRWSDLQMLVMLALAEQQLLSWVEIVNCTGGSETGVWNAIAAIRQQDCAETFDVNGKCYYHLSEKGRVELHNILK